MVRPKLPSYDTTEYLWWSQGARDEAQARDEKVTRAAREVRSVLEGFGHPGRELTAEELVTTLARIYCPARLRRRYRR